MDKNDAVERVLDIRDEIVVLLNEARALAAEHVGNEINSFDAYVFEQIKEHLTKGNRYNQDLEDVAKAIENSPDEEDDDDLLDDPNYVGSRMHY